MYKEAIHEFAACLAEGSADIRGYLALTFALAGARGRAEGMFADLISASADQYVSCYHFGAISLALGDVDDAFRWLDKAVEEHGRHVAALRLDPALARIRDDPRFEGLLAKIESLSRAWQAPCSRSIPGLPGASLIRSRRSLEPPKASPHHRSIPGGPSAPTL
jgi:hypothetical protein